MVVLDLAAAMPSNSSNQYLSPDYLPPMPLTLDAKNSPLALLAQTCSQIGADSPGTKPMISALEKSKKSTPPVVATHVPTKSASNDHKSPTENTLAFKPYESNVLTRKADRPPSSTEERRTTSRNSSRKSASASPNEKPTKVAETPMAKATSELYGMKDAFKAPLASYGCNGYSTGGGVEANPAFRNPFYPHPFLDAFQAPYAAAAAAANYNRLKSSPGAAAVCKDPFCFSCRFVLHGALGGSCPPGCLQCDPKYNAMLMANPMYQHQYGRPLVCSWVAGDSYCGKRFHTSEELLQHLRTHTNAAGDAAAVAAFMNQLRYPLNPLAARYHPYAKPLPSSLPSNPFGAFNPALPYYPPYPLYDQRVGAAVNP